MWRSLFLAFGISLLILGGECLVVDKAFLRVPPEYSQQPRFYQSQALAAVTRKELVPPEWAPWSLLSAGAVVSLYALTVNRNG